MECNEPHLTRGEKNSTFYSKGVIYKQKKSFASFFYKKITNSQTFLPKPLYY